MKRFFLMLVFILFSVHGFAQNEVGPEGHKLVWLLLFILVFFLSFGIYKFKKGKTKSPGIKKTSVEVQIEKDRLYFPDYLTLIIKNTGNTDIDLDRPLLIFDNFWLKRKFRLKGSNTKQFYPLYLDSGKTHTLQIDLNSFYGHDKKLKNFPKTKIIVYDIKGKRIGSKTVFLRKTLFKW